MKPKKWIVPIAVSLCNVLVFLIFGLALTGDLSIGMVGFFITAFCAFEHIYLLAASFVYAFKYLKNGKKILFVLYNAVCLTLPIVIVTFMPDVLVYPGGVNSIITAVYCLAVCIVSGLIALLIAKIMQKPPEYAKQFEGVGMDDQKAN